MAKKRRKPRPRRPASATAPAPAAPQTAKSAPKRPRKPIEEERPPAPWGSFPLVEIVVLVALVMLIAAIFVESRRPALVVTGLALGSLAGLELSIREHFSGFRSHTTLLAGAAGVATLAFLIYAVPDLLPPVARVVVAVAVAGLIAFALARAFRTRAGRYVKLR